MTGGLEGIRQGRRDRLDGRDAIDPGHCVVDLVPKRGLCRCQFGLVAARVEVGVGALRVSRLHAPGQTLGDLPGADLQAEEPVEAVERRLGIREEVGGVERADTVR